MFMLDVTILTQNETIDARHDTTSTSHSILVAVAALMASCMNIKRGILNLGLNKAKQTTCRARVISIFNMPVWLEILFPWRFGPPIQQTVYKLPLI